MVQGLLQKIDKFAIAPVHHSMGTSDFPPSLNPDIDARAEVKRYEYFVANLGCLAQLQDVQSTHYRGVWGCAEIFLDQTACIVWPKFDWPKFDWPNWIGQTAY